MESIFSEDNVTALVKATYKKHKTDKIKKYFTWKLEVGERLSLETVLASNSPQTPSNLICL